VSAHPPRRFGPRVTAAEAIARFHTNNYHLQLFCFRGTMFVMKPCSKCRKDNDRTNQRYCKACHAAYMREHRPKHSQLHPEARAKANCRAYANVYLKRGLLVRGPCHVCGATSSQMHHEDYAKPLEIRWLCRICHLDLHRKERNRALDEKNANLKKILEKFETYDP